MNSWCFLLKNLGDLTRIFCEQMRSVFIFTILYLVVMLPVVGLNAACLPSLSHLLIVQGLGMVTVIMQIDPSFRKDIEDGFLERWLGNQGLSFSYYIVRHLWGMIEIILPVILLSLLFIPFLEAKQTWVFAGVSFLNLSMAGLWTSCMALLLAGTQETGHSIVGMVFSALLLVPQLLIGEVLLSQGLTNTIEMSSIGLYAGVSLISLALNLSLAPTLIRLSVSY